MTLTFNLSSPGYLFVFNAKKTSLNSFSFKGFSRMEVVISGRHGSKFVLLDGILVPSNC